MKKQQLRKRLLIGKNLRPSQPLPGINLGSVHPMAIRQGGFPKDFYAAILS